MPFDCRLGYRSLYTDGYAAQPRLSLPLVGDVEEVINLRLTGHQQRVHVARVEGIEKPQQRRRIDGSLPDVRRQLQHVSPAGRKRF